MAYSLIYLSIASPLLTILIGFKSKAYNSDTLKYIFTLSIISFIADSCSLALTYIPMNNIFVIHIWGGIQTILLVLFFMKLLPNFSFIIKIIGAFYLFYYGINSLLIEGLISYNTLAMSFQSILMICLSLLFFYNIYIEETTIFLEKIPEFWIVVGILMYFSGALFSFLLATDILSQSPDRFYNSWALHNSANILKNILFAIGLWKLRLAKV